MPTTIHIPDPLLAKVDQRAKSLKLSRNRFILTALEKALEREPGWSPEFIDALSTFKPLDAKHDLRPLIENNRRSKTRPPSF